MKKALVHLKNDPILQNVIEKYGVLPEIETSADLFKDLIEAIASQQLSVKASDTIIKRLYTLVEKYGNLEPGVVLQIPDQEIRECGLSLPKIRYIKGLAEMIIKQEIMLDRLMDLGDDEVILQLTKVKGIGLWTAEMILIFSLGRKDIFSAGDVGLQNAIAKLYNTEVNKEKIQEITLKWSPYRSLASRYLWKSLDNK